MLGRNRTLTQERLRIARPRPARAGGYYGHCPFHPGSSGFDVMFDQHLARYCCTVCGVYGRVERERPR